MSKRSSSDTPVSPSISLVTTARVASAAVSLTGALFACVLPGCAEPSASVGLGGNAPPQPDSTIGHNKDIELGNDTFLARSGQPAHNSREGGPRCPADVPEALSPPANTTLAFALEADGVQIYSCRAAATPDSAPAWALEAPHALLGSPGRPEVIHFAGPTWQALDGSLITGARLASAPGPDTTAIPWLLLSATPAAAAGKFSTVSHVQRLNTKGGIAPTTGCDAEHSGARVLVPYTAAYYFYRAAEPRERVRQCGSSHKRS
jgi:hypothetical protein